MTSPAPRCGRTVLIANLAAVLLAAASLAHAQQSAPAGGSGATPAAKAPAKSGAAKAGAAEASDVSYSLGVSMGEQLRASGVSAGQVNSAHLAQGVRDGLAGKKEMTDADRQKISALLKSSYEAQADNNHRAAAKFLAENGKKTDVVTTASGLQYKVLAGGSGDSPKPSDEVTVNYRGTLLDGTEFDSSYKRGQPASFQVNRVIPGWTEALQLMRPGAKYQLFIPPQLAYDMRSRPPIPPGSMLVFDVELLSVKATPAAAGPAPAPATPAASAPGQAPKAPPPPK
jgi:FKBP-type peptidyl-prolyl cis-trans isomerase